MVNVTTAEVQRLGREIGLDAVGVARAEPYAETERHIRERRARGLFGRMRFTMAQPEVSCHPEKLVTGARTVISAALCYYAPEPERRPSQGRLPRYTWRDRYAELREKLDVLGRAITDAGSGQAGTGSLGRRRKRAPQGDYRVLVDANQHVDREAAARSGVGFYGKNTLVITRRHGSWVVLGTLVTTAELEPTPPLSTDCGSCTRCIDACPTGALDEPGVLDATRCLSYWTQAPGPVPEPYRAHLGAQVYGCDICQDVCPWNRGVERRRAGLAADPAAHVSLVDWLEADGGALRKEHDRLYVPRNDPRWLRRNALVALGNAGEADAPTRRALERYAEGGDELLAEHARWALSRLRSRSDRSRSAAQTDTRAKPACPDNGVASAASDLEGRCS
jgi:epoxyqueuosine reductase